MSDILGNLVQSTSDLSDEVINRFNLLEQRLQGFMTETEAKFHSYLRELEKRTPAGSPVPWPLATPPEGWLKCNGNEFNKSLYPELAKAYPSGKLPDLRGEFIRGWDDGRGVDAGREIFSWQKASLITGDQDADSVIFATGLRNPIFLKQVGWDKVHDSSLYHGESLKWFPQPILNQLNKEDIEIHAGLTRPRNIAFNYIVRAA
ncbi:MAG: phage tail protein [Enterobacteriaceae bacterium]